MSPALPTTKGAITQPELPSRAFRTHLTVRSRILKRYLKETFCLSFPFLCSPGASDITERYELRNARIRELGAAVRCFFFPAVMAQSYVAVISLTVAVIVCLGAPQG